MSFESDLKYLDERVSKFEELVKNYPLCEAYKYSLRMLYIRRMELVNTLGRKK